MKNRRKVIPHCYKKWGSRMLSNRSLSQLLEIGSLKKRINDLSKNNRLLTSALQESLVDTAYQNSLLKSYAKDINQILFARIKLNKMAKNLAKFATDLEEVRSCLDISLPTEYNFFQKKGSSNERISKVPDISCIDEVPESSENETEARESTLDVFQSSLEENMALKSHNVEMSPILFVDNSQDIPKKRSSGVYKGSLTPQLKIDTEFIKPKRSTRSRGKTPSLGKKNSIPGGLFTYTNTVLSPLMHPVLDAVETKKMISKNSLDVNNIVKETENIDIPFQNCSDESVSISHCDLPKIQSSDLITINKQSTTSNLDLNCPSEINVEFCPLQPLYNESSLPFAIESYFEDNSEVHTNVQNINSVSNQFLPKRGSEKLATISQKASSLPCKLHNYDEEIQNVGSLTFCESDDDNDRGHNEKRNRISPMIRRSRSKKSLNYAEYSSSGESDIDSPFKLNATKRSGSKRIKLNSTSIGKSCEKTSTENAGEISSHAITEISEIDYSVYNLDVSNSRKVRKRHKKKPSSKNKNELPKPLFQKCSVTKLKGGKLKFSKCNTSMDLILTSKQAEKSLQNTCVSPGGILKKVQSSVTKICEDKRNDTSLNETEDINSMQDNKQQSTFHTPKRVSFAPTDLVCKFEKMSESKKIADNKKIRRTSKSAIDLKELFEKDQSRAFSEYIDNSPEKTDVQKSNDPIPFDFSADTEIYTVKLPSNIQFPVLQVDDVAFSNMSTAIVSEETSLVNTNSNVKGIEKSPGTPNNLKNTKKLSLKANRISHNEVSECNFEKSGMEATVLFLGSPVSLVKPPKRKSLFKESPDHDLKENISSNSPAVEKKDPLKNEICVNKNSSFSTPTTDIKTSLGSKCQSKVHSKSRKNKKSNMETKSLVQSPVLIDATNIIGETHSRRRSKQVCYKEPNLIKKLRR